jgi:hypothetical protein
MFRVKHAVVAGRLSPSPTSPRSSPARARGTNETGPQASGVFHTFTLMARYFSSLVVHTKGTRDVSNNENICQHVCYCSVVQFDATEVP